MLLLPARCLLACALILAPAWSWAVDTSSGTPLTLREAVARALEHSPQLRSFPLVRRVAEAQRLQAGLRPNPELSLGFENFGGSGEVRGTQALESTLSLSQLIELGGKRAHRVESAGAAYDAVEADYLTARLDVLGETVRRYTDVAQTQADLEIANRAVGLTDAVSSSIERRIRAGAASTAERNRASVVLIRAKLDQARARAELETRKVALASMWGEAAADFPGVTGDLEHLPSLLDQVALTDQLAKSPALMRFAAERRLREAELKLAKAEAVPNLSVGAGVRRLNATDDFGLVASLSLPLPMFNRNQGNIAAADARIAQSDTEREIAYLQMRATVYGLYRESVQARARAMGLRDQAIPQADQALTLIQRGFENGRFSFLELADAQRQVLELRTETTAAFADAHRLDAEIERLTGLPISAPTIPSGDAP